jgi:hypothetical protein
MRKYCDGEENPAHDFDRFEYSGPPQHEKVVSGMPRISSHAYICRYVPMDASLGPEGLDGFCLYLVFKSLSVLGSCLVNIKILAKKIHALYMGPKIQNRSNDLD